jgi:hypothetical protein
VTTKGISVGDETSMGDGVSLGDKVSVGDVVSVVSGVSVDESFTVGDGSLVATGGTEGDGEEFTSMPLHAADIKSMTIIKHNRPGRYFFKWLTLLKWCLLYVRPAQYSSLSTMKRSESFNSCGALVVTQGWQIIAPIMVEPTPSLHTWSGRSENPQNSLCQCKVEMSLFLQSRDVPFSRD